MLSNIEFVIACGGVSSRNYPHSKGIAHKALMPFGDGRLIDFILNEIVNAGGKHVTIVCSNQRVVDIFKEALRTDDATENKLRSKGFIAIADAIKRTFLPDHLEIKYVIQDKPLGTAHVMALAHRVSPDRHGVLIFPDDIIVSTDPKQNYMKRMVEQFSKDPHQILGYGVPKEDVSNNAIVQDGRLVEKPKNPTSHVGLYSPIFMPKENLDFVEQQFSEIEKTGKMPEHLSGGEWVYVDGINAFLDAQPIDTPFHLAVVEKSPTDILLDTGTLPLYQQAQLFSLLKLSRFKDENRAVAEKLLQT